MRTEGFPPLNDHARAVLGQLQQIDDGRTVCITTEISPQSIWRKTRKIDTPTELHQHKLKELAERLDQFHRFAKGQFVKWKPGLKNRKFPDYGEPVIVTAVLPSPIFDPGEGTAGSPYFQEPLTFVVRMCREDEFLEFRL